ncbi:MAG: ethanolamine ammonia-lyase reactivating factor EutA [Xanthobacteraceae bacterium]
MNDESGGRVFFSSTGRTLGDEDQLNILSVGVDIGSSTSHLAFSRIVLERLDTRYVVVERETFFESEILLTPYADGDLIDADSLGKFIEREYRSAQVEPDEIDTGALILTGVAVQRKNARRIAELFARQAGKMVAVSAGDALETTMAAYGSGAVARSIRDAATIMNIDVGGGTSKIAVCAEGVVEAVTAVDVGARLICFDDDRRITRIEDAGQRYLSELGLNLRMGSILNEASAEALASVMADRLMAAIEGKSAQAGSAPLLRLAPLAHARPVDLVTISGGVAEYFYGRQKQTFGDLGPLLAAAVRDRLEKSGLPIASPTEHIRATVIGASQFTTQVSGSTIYVSPLDALPLRNVPVIAPRFEFGDDEIDRKSVGEAIGVALNNLEAGEGTDTVAVFVSWSGSATYQRLDSFCRGLIDGLAPALKDGRPMVVVGDGDVGGLLGIHCRQELRLPNPIVSIDGLELKQFDFIDVGSMLENSGAVPVVIKSLIFPSDVQQKR